MAQNLVKCSQEPRTTRHQNDSSPTLLQGFANIVQRTQVVRQMFNDVQANDGVKLLFLRIRACQLPVRITNVQVWPIPANVLEVCEVQRIYIAGPIQLAWN